MEKTFTLKITMTDKSVRFDRVESSKDLSDVEILGIIELLKSSILRTFTTKKKKANP